MILLIDAGNSRIKWACLVGGVLQAGEPVSRDGGAMVDLQTLALAWAPLPRPDRVLAVSVLGEDFAAALSRWVRDRWAVEVEYVAARDAACGVVNGYRAPERLGADRWAALIGARRIARGPVCIVDCGTAVTIDSMGRDGHHRGGLILPGLRLMERSLSEGTQGVRPSPEPAAVGGLQPFAADTAEAVRSGALYALVAAVDRVTREVRRSLGRNLRCMLTGGDAEYLMPLLAGRFDHQPELVLRGLAVLAEEGR